MFSLRVDDELVIELAEMWHAQEIYDLVDRNREHLRPWMPWEPLTTSVADTTSFLTSVRAEYAAGRQFHANLRYGGTLVGAIGMPSIDRANRTGEIGYWLGAEHTGRGIMTRATAALTTAAFREMGLHRVAIAADVANARSRAVPERLGFTFEGVLRGNKVVHGRSVDHAWYGMLEHDWDAGTLPG
ncbi:MAG TPA: GNAT family protein [Mycobacteriales bacterium]|jgi:ribosomal-protein-serine acetyltransferase|nr:GNAT family protein [Mycobacteriales bacterium]